MINLLPIKEREELILAQNKKIAIILGFAILIISICLILILLSIKFYILGESVSQKFILEQAENKYQTSDFLTYKGLLQGYNKNFIQLKSFYKDKVQFNAALKNILEVERPEGVYFTDLFLTRSEDTNKIEAKLFGISNTRDNLLLFKKNLEERPKGYPEIKNPNFSSESWINSKDISFYLTFEANGN